jgi:hypothetical protein
MGRRTDAVVEDLKAVTADGVVIKTVQESLKRNFPPKVYIHAVWFLGLATLVLVTGAVACLLKQKEMSEAMWTAIGAGIGALAGIFTAQNGT